VVQEIVDVIARKMRFFFSSLTSMFPYFWSMLEIVYGSKITICEFEVVF
jgi:hypothetical protein